MESAEVQKWGNVKIHYVNAEEFLKNLDKMKDKKS